jgi:hypothetical protein
VILAILGITLLAQQDYAQARRCSRSLRFIFGGV